MATPNPNLVLPMADPRVAGLESGASWLLGPDRTLTWSLSNNNGYAWTNPQASVAFFASVLAQWSQVANIHFQFVGIENLATHSADITFANTDSSLLGFGAISAGIFPNANFGNLWLASEGLNRNIFPHPEGTVLFNTLYASRFDWLNPGSYAYHTALHEIGHALGLKHPFDGGFANYPTFQQLGTATLDNGLETVMSYGQTSATLPSGWSASPMPLDILAIQQLYGANPQSESSDHHYLLQDDGALRTIWDPAGAALDASTIQHGVTLDLHQGQVSRLGTLSAVGIAFGTTVDAVAGTGFNDTMICNDTGDTILGSGGSDALVGGGGFDTVSYALLSRSCAVSQTGQGLTVQKSPGQTDSLTGIEALRFVDGTLNHDASSPAAQVARLYQAALGRAADAPGMAGWTGVLQAGVPLASLAAAFLNGPEFQARFGSQDTNGFVTQLYSNVLHRAPDATGFANWANALNSGSLDRAGALVAFSESQENKAGTASLVSNGLWTADETAAQVARLYYSALGRAPDAAGLAAWTVQMESGATTLQQEAQAFLGSAEFQAKYGNLNNRSFVDALYRNVLGRAPDQTGEAGWTAQLDSGAAGRPTVLIGFSESAEHQSMMAPVIENGGIVVQG